MAWWTSRQCSGRSAPQLQSLARSRSLPAGLSDRARIILSSADGELNNSIAQRLRLTNATMGKRRMRFIERRIAGLYDDVRPGKPCTIDDERIAQLIKTTLYTKPADGSTHWSVRTVAAETGISKTSVQRYFRLFGLQPHRSEGFKLSTDPFFIEKLRDVVGLYLSPPENALVPCVDEKSQCYALERTQPMLPMGFGYVEGVTHDYKRHGTTTLFAALNVFNGAVHASCKPRHRHQEFLAFLRKIDKAVPHELDIHCIVDNYATHRHPATKAWLLSRPRWHLHFIPTYSSWLNQVERFFALIPDRAIRRGSCTSVKQLAQRIDHFVAHLYQRDSTLDRLDDADGLRQQKLVVGLQFHCTRQGVTVKPGADHRGQALRCAVKINVLRHGAGGRKGIGLSLRNRNQLHARVVGHEDQIQRGAVDKILIAGDATHVHRHH